MLFKDLLYVHLYQNIQRIVQENDELCIPTKDNIYFPHKLHRGTVVRDVVLRTKEFVYVPKV